MAILAAVAVAAVIVLVGWVADSQRSLAVQEQLTGKWTFERVDDSELWICEFREGGDAFFYPVTEPSPHSTEDGDIRWTISGGDLMLTYDHHFTRDATFRLRFRQISGAIENWWNAKDLPLSHGDHLVIHDEGGDSIVIEPHPNPSMADGFWTDSLTLTRVEDSQIPALRKAEGSRVNNNEKTGKKE